MKTDQKGTCPQSFFPEYLTIPLENGGFTIIDEADVDRVSPYKWFRAWSNESSTWYVARNLAGEPRRKSYLHRELLGLDEEDPRVVDHRNHDGLDNRRSENIRIATRRQNTTNSRKKRGSISRYKGVTVSAGKWRAVIRVASLKANVVLGVFDVEEEAAFAYHVAAPLVFDPDFVYYSPIPVDATPNEARSAEIRAQVVERIKARLSGQKRATKTTSRFVGVSLVASSGSWAAAIIRGKTTYKLGLFDSELKAAYAVNCGISRLGLTRKRNLILDGDIDHEAEEGVRSLVDERISGYESGKKRVFHDKASPYTGVHVTKDKVYGKQYWFGSINIKGERVNIGSYPNDIETATAYRLACELSGTDKSRGVLIPDHLLPEPEIVKAIREKVARKLGRATKPRVQAVNREA